MMDGACSRDAARERCRVRRGQTIVRDDCSAVELPYDQVDHAILELAAGRADVAW